MRDRFRRFFARRFVLCFLTALTLVAADAAGAYCADKNRKPSPVVSFRLNETGETEIYMATHNALKARRSHSLRVNMAITTTAFLLTDQRFKRSRFPSATKLRTWSSLSRSRSVSLSCR